MVDRAGNAIAGSSTFSGGSPHVQVSSGGTVEARTIGRAKIDVQVGAFTDSAFTTVVPDGAMAVYSFGNTLGEPTGFGQVNLDGSGFKWIARTGTVGSGYSPGNPVSKWIPGTGQLLYARVVDASPRLFVGDSTESAKRLIDQPFPVVSETDPEVSRNGRWIYFVARDSFGIEAIWRVPPSGGGPERLTTEDDGSRFRWPSLSPDGTRLAYIAAASEGRTYHAFVRDLASGVSVQLGPNQAAGPLWSPTGEWILYSANGPGGYPGALHIVHPDGTGDRVLVSGAAYLAGGTWSPDGKYVIAARGDFSGGGPFNVLELIDIATGSQFPLPYPSGWYGPSWRQ